MEEKKAKSLEIEERFEEKKEAPKKNEFWILFLLGVSLNLLGAFLLWYRIKPTDSAVILHYNSFLGIDIIDFDLRDDYYKLFGVSAVGLIICLTNFILSFLVFKQADRFLDEERKQEAAERQMSGYLLLISSILVQMGILVYILAIIRVNS
ncbi:MAG: hypothetical protein PHQ20_00540 [Candidatus Moranbacteria bacterium]|jgi:uncharacterized membrane protein|nr:hypothetical protein [Candidatus Moranbacteria bacterium]